MKVAKSHFYRPQTKLREGNVFTGVCDSVHRGKVMFLQVSDSVHRVGGAWSGGCLLRGVPGPGGGWPGPGGA